MAMTEAEKRKKKKEKAAKKKAEEEGGAKPGQLPPTFTDMLALLLTFFVFLMTMAQFDEATIQDMFAHMSVAFGSIGDAGTGSLNDGASFSKEKAKMSGGSDPLQAKSDPRATLRGGSEKKGQGSKDPTPKISTAAMDQDSGGDDDFDNPSPGDPDPQNDIGEESSITVARAEQEQLAAGMMDLGDMPGVDASLTSQGLKIELQEDFVQFPSGTADMPPGAAPKMEALIREKLKGFIDDKFEISVIGHTDDIPLGQRTAARYGDNRGLSTERANTVLRMFEKLGVNPRQISAQGYGPHKPKDSNDTAEGRATNRRIEILVKYKVFSKTDWGEDIIAP